jgi:hypothetical protein
LAYEITVYICLKDWAMGLRLMVLFQLPAEAEELRQKYLKKYSNALEAAQGAVLPVSANVEALRSSFICDSSEDAREVRPAASKAGLPDFSWSKSRFARFFLVQKQVCQSYQNGKKLPNDHKIYQKAVHKLYQTSVKYSKK